MKTFITLTLLFSFAFSSIHEYVFAVNDTNPCSVTEYVAEIEAPSHHGDICDIHSEYHHAFILADNTLQIMRVFSPEKLISDKQEYHYRQTSKFFKPPRT